MAGPLRCVNCGAAMQGAFCAQCGQEARVELPGLFEFLGDGIGRLLALDGRLWLTLKTLLWQPGELSLEYLRGRRKRYVRPARLYFWLSVLLFAALRLTTAPVSVAPQGGEARAGASLFTVGGPSVAIAAQDAASAAAFGQAYGANARTAIPVSKRLEQRLAGIDHPLARRATARLLHYQSLPSEERAAQLNDGLLRFGPYALFALLPLFAGLTQLAHWMKHRRAQAHRPRRYVEHLVVATHLHCAAFVLALPALLLPFEILPPLLSALFLLYVVLAQRHVYGGSWWAGLLRAGAVGLVYALCLVSCTVLMLVLAMLL